MSHGNVNAGRTEPLALYVHWPFCVSKCPYCDFNSHVRETVDQDAWRTALLGDLEHEAALTAGRPLSSVFLGGGTPSLMPPETVEAVLKAAERHWGFAEHVEITLEANPSSVEAARFADLASAGVNRVSLGLQALEDEALCFLGRAHGVREGLAALEAAQRLFARVSFDLIYARPGQDEADWETELRQALSLGTTHLSLYQLTIEPGTRFDTMVRKGAFIPADADHAAGLFELTRLVTAEAGLPAYEISNHARPGEESRHNLIYWRYQDYVGIGPGAHGRRNGMATQRRKKPENWLAALARNGHGLESETTLSSADKATEALLMGLRLKEGVDLTRIAEMTGKPRDDLINQQAADQLATLGLIRLEGDRLQVEKRGMLLLDAILPEIISSRLFQ